MADRPFIAPLAVLAFLAAASAGPATAQEEAGTAAAELDPQRLELARRIIAVAYPPEGRRAMLLGAVDAMTAQIRTAAAAGGAGEGLDSGARRIVERYLERSRAEGEKAIDAHVSALFDSYARGYARQFTAAELIEIQRFVATPAGAKYVQRSPQLLSDPDVARANSAYIATVMAALQPLQADLRRELTDYFGKNPPK